MTDTELREGIAELEHNQWVKWSKSLAPALNDILLRLPEGSNEADTLYERLQRWAKLWIPYAELTKEQKDQDRYWADIVLQALKEPVII